jgi:hypothetical protein
MIAIVIAVIALVASVSAAALTAFGAPAMQARRDAREKLEKYRGPLLDSSYELQARLHNILSSDFVKNFMDSDGPSRREAAINTTLYVFAQFFGWREIIRRDIQYLHFPENSKTSQILVLLREVEYTFLSEAYGPQFMIWRVEQRGIGEEMIESTGGTSTCLGYSSFIERRSTMGVWLDPIEQDLQRIEEGGRKRLTELQHSLLDLVIELDDQRKYHSSAVILEKS